MPQNIKIAVAQCKVEDHNPTSNLARIQTFIQRAAKRHANVVLLPEACVTGLITNQHIGHDKKGASLKAIQNMARENAVDVVAGSIVERSRGKYYVTSSYIDSHGSILGRHRKNYLWGTEKGPCTPANGVRVIQTSYGKVGILICWDMAFGSLWQRLMDQGVQIVFCPSYWSFEDARQGLRYNRLSEVEFIDSLIVSRAFEYEVTVVFCNAVNENPKAREGSIGHSQIALPFLGATSRLEHNHEGMIVQTIDLGILKVAEQVYQIRKDSF